MFEVSVVPLYLVSPMCEPRLSSAPRLTGLHHTLITSTQDKPTEAELKEDMRLGQDECRGWGAGCRVQGAGCLVSGVRCRV